MKLCINCKHVIEGNRQNMERCGAPQNFSDPNPVSGKQEARWIYCTSHRVEGFIASFMVGTCGKRGRWYEPK